MSYISHVKQPDGTLLNVSLRDHETNTNAVVVDGSGVTQPISAVALPLPAGASTSALQGTANGYLNSLDSHLPPPGQALMAASVPVVIASDQAPLVLPFGWALSMGLVPGYAPWYIVGYNPDVDNVEEDVWEGGGLYVFPAGEIQMEVVSSSANDDGSPAGTGVQTVKINYLDSAFAVKETDVVLNGVGAVVTAVSDIFRVNRFIATAIGTGHKAAGDILLRPVGGGVTYSKISTGYTQARQSIYTVPAGKTLHISEAIFGAGVTGAGNWVRFFVRANYDSYDDVTRDFFLPFTTAMLQGGSTVLSCQIIPQFIAGTDIVVSVIGDAPSTNGACSCSMFGFLRDI